MSGKHSRNKGQRGEREVAAAFTEAGFEARRNCSESQTGNAGDLVIDGPFMVQVKRYAKRANWRRAWDEAAEVCPSHHYPLACTRTDGDRWYVHLTLEDFLEIACCDFDS